MLLESGDLFPVVPEAVDIPWTKRKNLITSFLLRGSVDFQTLVYDNNVGDIAPLSMYFNPRKWTVLDLNEKFGQIADHDDRSETSSNLTIGPGSDMKSATLLPRLVIFREKEKLFEDSRSDFLSLSPTFPVGVWSIPPPILVTPSLPTSIESHSLPSSTASALPPTLECQSLPTSKLPSPPKKSPPQLLRQNCCHVGETNHIVAPPKRRKLSVIDSSSALTVAHGALKPKSASTSSPWTPLFSPSSLSPFLFFESTHDKVFDENDNDNIDSVHDEQTLARSLRKIAKAFECNDEW